MKRKQWKASDLKNVKYIGILEFQDNSGEYHTFEVLETKNKIVFGGSCNIGFLESGYILKDGFSTDEVLQELLSELEVFYNDGSDYTSNIIFNKRM